MSDEELLIMKQIGSRIRTARQKSHMSQAKLAELSNVSLPIISNIENGKSVMLLDTFIRIINVLHVSADTILRCDTPGVNAIYQMEFSEILSDCSPQESEAIINMAKQLKITLRATKEADNY